MASTNIWRVQSPALNTAYDAPNGFWVLPGNGTNFTVQWNAYKADNSGAATMNVTLRNVKVPGYTLQSSFNQVGVNGVTFISSNGHNGVQEFTCGFQITGGTLPDHCEIFLSAYTGTPHTILRLRRSGVWVTFSGDKIKLRRSGAWGGLVSGSSVVIAQVPQVLVRRTGAWVEV